MPHHLVDIADPREDFDLARYVREASAAIRGIAERGAVPIVVGGTGLYLRGLLRGIIAAPPRNAELRERLRGIVSRHGAARLHRWLRRIDPDSAERLPPGDAQRIVRAAEIALEGAESWSETIRREGTWRAGPERFDSLKVGLDLEPRALAVRLAERVDGFFAAGLVDEVARLRASGVPHSSNAFKAIGYREVLGAFVMGADPDKVRERVVISTRRYAKRQRTWFRKETGVRWLDADAGPDALASEIVAMWIRETSRRVV